jgi:hypothetical protein
MAFAEVGVTLTLTRTKWNGYVAACLTFVSDSDRTVVLRVDPEYITVLLKLIFDWRSYEVKTQLGWKPQYDLLSSYGWDGGEWFEIVLVKDQYVKDGHNYLKLFLNRLIHSKYKYVINKYNNDF